LVCGCEFDKPVLAAPAFVRIATVEVHCQRRSGCFELELGLAAVGEVEDQARLRVGFEPSDTPGAAS